MYEIWRASDQQHTKRKKRVMNKKIMKIRDETTSNESRNKKNFIMEYSVLFHFKNVDERD